MPYSITYLRDRGGVGVKFNGLFVDTAFLQVGFRRTRGESNSKLPQTGRINNKPKTKCLLNDPTNLMTLKVVPEQNLKAVARRGLKIAPTLRIHKVYSASSVQKERTEPKEPPTKYAQVPAGILNTRKQSFKRELVSFPPCSDDDMVRHNRLAGIWCQLKVLNGVTG